MTTIVVIEECMVVQFYVTSTTSLTWGASGYSSLLGNLSVDTQNPPLVFKTLQYQNMWASYDTLEKTIILSFAGKASVKRKGLQKL